jgi:D-glycero-D-manno-heptose 1,7-bisphosphate phosphatase
MGIGDTLNRPCVFLDRDGVLNRAVVRGGRPYPPARPEDVEILPGVPEAVSLLSRAGFALVVVTNQPDVARGTTTLGEVEAINKVVGEGLAIDQFRVCYHDDKDGCDCRKPAPGLLTGAAEELNLDLTTSFMVGDRWRDIEAGNLAGCRTVWIDYGYDEKQPANYALRTDSLLGAARWILEQR